MWEEFTEQINSKPPQGKIVGEQQNKLWALSNSESFLLGGGPGAWWSQREELCRGKVMRKEAPGIIPSESRPPRSKQSAYFTVCLTTLWLYRG